MGYHGTIHGTFGTYSLGYGVVGTAQGYRLMVRRCGGMCSKRSAGDPPEDELAAALATKMYEDVCWLLPEASNNSKKQCCHTRFAQEPPKNMRKLHEIHHSDALPLATTRGCRISMEGLIHHSSGHVPPFQMGSITDTNQWDDHHSEFSSCQNSK